jgi:hypothetical protein
MILPSMGGAFMKKLLTVFSAATGIGLRVFREKNVPHGAAVRSPPNVAAATE